MGFRFSKRINIGKGLGINLSNSGVTPSIRTKLGSISTKGYSLKTGIPGVSYRNSFNKSKSGCAGIFLLTIITFSIYLFKHYYYGV
jgi:hypothetical protein